MRLPQKDKSKTEQSMLHIRELKNKKVSLKKKKKRSSFTLELSSIEDTHAGLASSSRAFHSATTETWSAGKEGDGGTLHLERT